MLGLGGLGEDEMSVGGETPSTDGRIALPPLGGFAAPGGLEPLREEMGEAAADDGEVEAAIGLEFMVRAPISRGINVSSPLTDSPLLSAGPRSRSQARPLVALRAAAPGVLRRRRRRTYVTRRLLHLQHRRPSPPAGSSCSGALPLVDARPRSLGADLARRWNLKRSSTPSTRVHRPAAEQRAERRYRALLAGSRRLAGELLPFGDVALLATQADSVRNFLSHTHLPLRAAWCRTLGLVSRRVHHVPRMGSFARSTGQPGLVGTILRCSVRGSEAHVGEGRCRVWARRR